MTWAILSFRHPQDWHEELVVDVGGGVARRFMGQGPPLGGGALKELGPLVDPRDLRRYLEAEGGKYENVGVWKRIEGGSCEVLENEPDRLVLRIGERTVALGARGGRTWRVE